MITKIHRICAVLFLLAVPPAGIFSFRGDPLHPSPVVYLPLFPLFVLMITGTYQLVLPWIHAYRGRGAGAK